LIGWIGPCAKCVRVHWMCTCAVSVHTAHVLQMFVQAVWQKSTQNVCNIMCRMCNKTFRLEWPSGRRNLTKAGCAHSGQQQSRCDTPARAPKSACSSFTVFEKEKCRSQSMISKSIQRQTFIGVSRGSLSVSAGKLGWKWQKGNS
jgi:hypothetical protein